MPSLNEVMQNARDFLDVAEGMDEAGINRAFKRQARFHHSDKKTGSTKAFQRLNAAKELLIGGLLFGSIDLKNNYLMAWAAHEEAVREAVREQLVHACWLDIHANLMAHVREVASTLEPVAKRPRLAPEDSEEELEVLRSGEESDGEYNPLNYPARDERAASRDENDLSRPENMDFNDELVKAAAGFVPIEQNVEAAEEAAEEGGEQAEMDEEERETYKFVHDLFETSFKQTFRLCEPSEWPKGLAAWKTRTLVAKMKARGTWPAPLPYQLPNAYARKFIKGAFSDFDNSALNFYLRRRFRGVAGAKCLWKSCGRQVCSQPPSFKCFAERA